MIGFDVLKKALHAKNHPGISRQATLVKLAAQATPYLTSLSGRAKPPMTIYWNVNSVCNLRCKMCDVGTFNEQSNFFKNLRIDRKLHEILPEVFERVVNEVKQYNCVMAINGTEPMMYKPLGELIEITNRAGLTGSVTTGAYNLEDRAHELADAGLKRLLVSLDGPPEVHNQIRGRKQVFERATHGIEMFVEQAQKNNYTPEVTANFTITSLNFGELVNFYHSVRNMGLARINFVNMNFVTDDMAREHNAKWGGRYTATQNCISDEVQPGKVDVAVLSEQIRELEAIGDERVHFLPNFERKALTRYYEQPEQFLGNIPCMSSWFIAQVMADGEIIPYTRCYHVPFGNINEQPFLEAWNSDAANAWRRDLRRHRRFPACTRCDMVY